jgi:hypothetical protein
MTTEGGNTVPRMAHVLLNRLITKPGQRERVEILLEFAEALNGSRPERHRRPKAPDSAPRWARRDVSASAGDISPTASPAPIVVAQPSETGACATLISDTSSGRG